MTGTTSPVVDQVVAWAQAQTCGVDGSIVVPGADDVELQGLLALGGLARAVVPRVPAGWPMEVRRWMTSGPEPPSSLVTSVKSALAVRLDVFAAAYERLVSPLHRRKLGTYFTPPAVVDYMLDEAETIMTSLPAEVIDPGAGVGALSIGARKRWDGCVVYAVDLNPVTLGLLAARAAARKDSAITIVLADYLTWLADAATDDQPRLFLGNPPYTRYRDLLPDLRRSAQRAAGTLVPDGMPGLSHYFLAATLKQLRPDDAIVFLLPGTWMEARYGRPAIRWLWHETRRPIRFSWFPHSTPVFPDAVVNAMVVAVGPERQPVRHRLLSREVSVEGTRVVVRHAQEFVRKGEPPSRFDPWLWPTVKAGQTRLVPLGSIARVRRGIATGDNSFFFLTDEEAARLPRDAVRPALRRLRDCPGEILNVGAHDEIGADGKCRWLLWLHDPKVVYDPRVQALIREGERREVDVGHLTGKRRAWYAVEDVKPPHLLISPMSQDKFRVVRNDIGALPSNAMYGIYLPVDDEVATMLLHRHLNGPEGQARLLETSRRYGNGLFKIEPRALSKALVLYLPAFDLQPSLLTAREAAVSL
jgi:adenine-specific DNA-methyltransferase